MPIGAVHHGPGRTQLEEGEVLLRRRDRKEQGFNFHHFERWDRERPWRSAWPPWPSAPKPAVRDHREGRCAFGSVAPTVFTSRLLNDTFAGNTLNTAVLDRAAAIIRKG
jgi:CO/xanthine dehydrogenase FAD-binding subunit